MPVARFEMPDGRIGRFEVPEGTTPEQAQALITESLAQQPSPSSGNRFDLRGEGYERLKNYDPTDTVGGIVRGAGSIGATVLAPLDVAGDALRGKGLTLDANRQRRADMDAGLQAFGVDTNSSQFQANKLATEVAGTMGVGGAVANALGRIPGASAQIPALLNAIRTGGMTTGAPAGASRVADMATRVAGGAVSGGATAGLVDPKDTGTGMTLGGTFPMAAKVLGGAADAVGSLFRAPPVNATKLQTAKDAMDAGYVIPPSQIKPSFGNRVIESTSGKLATQQIASTKNQAVTERLARQALGLPADAPLTFETMKAYRSAQHQAGYEPLRQVGMIPAGAKFNQALDDIFNQYRGKGTIPAIAGSKQEIADLVTAHKSNGFDAGDAVDAIRTLREDASALFTSNNAADKAKAKATKAIADAYEAAIDDALAASGQRDLLTAYRAARKNIAKSGTVEKAIREGSGTLDARSFAKELQKNKPLEGELLTAGRFANTFDKAAQPPHLIGSPAVHNLTSMFSTGGAAGGGVAGAFLGGPLGAGAGAALGAAYPYVVPPLARARMFSQGGQRGLLSQGPGSQGLLGASLDEALPLLYRSTPLLAGRSGQ